MNIDEQVRIMEAQLSNFDSLLEKMMYLTQFFGPDDMFTREAQDIVRSNIARKLKEEGK